MVYKCTYCGEKSELGVRILKPFPSGNPVLLQSWLKKLDLGPNFVPTKHSRLCSDHFTKDCVQLHERKFALAQGSIPSLFGTRICKLCVCCGAKSNDSVHRTFHSFPLHKTELLQVWIKSTKLKDFVPSKTSLICSDHFKNDYFLNNLRTTGRLKHTAVPTIVRPHIVNVCSAKSGTYDQMTIDDQNPGDPVISISEVGPSNMSSSDVPTNGSTEEKQQPTPDKFKYMEHDHHYHTSPRSLKRKLFEQQGQKKKLRRENRVKQQHIKRLKTRIGSLKDMRYAKNSRKSSRKIALQKRQGCPSSTKISREQYPPALRSFAMTLHFYSPKAYDFVRRKFCFALPHPSTLRSWYSTVNGDPGFTAESFDALKYKVDEAKENGREIIVAFMLDEMGIKKGLQYLPNAIVRGYVDLGIEMETDDTLPEAKDALVLLLTAYGLREDVTQSEED